MPTSANDELTKAKMYAFVDGEYVEVMEIQGICTLSEADEKAWQDDYVGVIRCGKCRWHYDRDNDIVCGNSGDVVQADDYCSYGERKIDETD